MWSVTADADERCGIKRNQSTFHICLNAHYYSNRVGIVICDSSVMHMRVSAARMLRI